MDNLPELPSLIAAGFAVDDRGQVTFANSFNFEKIRRFYMVENFSTNVVRAFHGHMKEEKYVFAVAGSAIVAAVRLDDPAQPSRRAKVHRFVLSDRQPQTLHIPEGYANGFRPLEPGTQMLFFSTATVEESRADDYRFPYDYWGADIWSVEFR